jgi:hypothetical protein
MLGEGGFIADSNFFIFEGYDFSLLEYYIPFLLICELVKDYPSAMYS